MTLRRIGVAVAAAATMAAGVSAAAPGWATADRISPIADDHVYVREFKTPGDGYFYTTDPAEDKNATDQYHFTKTGEIGMLHAGAAPGTVAVHRLRARDGDPSYMLSVSPDEIADSRFVDDGVLGYIDQDQQPGEVAMLRFSNNGKWRVIANTGEAAVNAVTAAGYNLDGPVGWFQL